MYQLHIANKNYSSWSLRPWVLMKELGIPFDEIMHPFGVEDDWKHFTRLNPSGKVPCLLVNKTEVIWDSLAIIEYLAEKYGSVWPNNSKARHWARCATAEMHASFSELRNACSMNCGLRIRLNTISSALAKDITRIDGLWKSGLSQFGGPFLAGETFSAVDAFYAPVVFRFQTYGIELSAESQIYRDNLLSVESMQSWYEAALSESFRDEAHERDCTLHGEITADLRNA